MTPKENLPLEQRIQEIAERLHLHPTTSAISLLLQDYKKEGGNEAIIKDLQAILNYHKQHRLNNDQYRSKIEGNSMVSVLPIRGCVITDLILDGTPIFYHDEETTEDMEKSLRGGFWMFPYAGPARPGTDAYDLQHGYARASEWKPTKEGKFKLDIDELRDEDSTDSVYAHALSAEQDVQITDNKAIFSLDVQNNGPSDLPCAPGFHAYYHVPIEQKGKIVLSGLNIGDREIRAYATTGIGPNNESTLKFLNPGSQTPINFSAPNIGTIQIKLSDEFTYVRVRTEVDKPFICIEPVARDARNEPMPFIKLGEKKAYRFSVELLVKDSF